MRDKLREEIFSRRLVPGQKLMSTMALAKEYGVALSTAHEALSELVAEGLLTRRQGKGTFIAAPKSTATQGDKAVALLLPSSEHLWGDLSRCLVKELRLRGCHAVLLDGDHLQGLPDGAPDWEDLLRRQFAALIIGDISLATRYLRRSPQSTVIVMAPNLLPTFPGNSVWVDVYRTAYDGTRRLADAGLTRIGCCCFHSSKSPLSIQDGEGWMREVDLLQLGYRDALRDAGLKPDQIIDQLALREEGRPLADYFKEHGLPEGFFCGNDFQAVTVSDAAKELGIDIPGQLKLVSVHNTPWAEAYQLTSFDSRPDRMAYECGKILDDKDTEGDGQSSRRRVLVTPEIVVRKSCP